MDVRDIARVCHEANRAYCAALEDFSQLPWSEAPDWQRESCEAGVQFHADNPLAGPADSHQEWLDYKRAEGWVYGPRKNPERKEHPCMVPYHELPAEQRRKDALFNAVVRALL